MEVTKDTLLYIALFLVPGFSMNAAYSSLVPQRVLDQQVATLRYLCFSFLNYVLWFWLLYDLVEKKYWVEHPIMWIVYLFGILVISPYILGFIAGIVTTKTWMRKLLQRVGLNPVHAVPTAWDYIMSNGSYVIVTLKDGAIIYGLYSNSSFASSVPEERDVYLEAVYDWDPEVGGDWVLKERTKGIWIAKNEIQLIEFLGFEEGADNNESGETSSQ